MSDESELSALRRKLAKLRRRVDVVEQAVREGQEPPGYLKVAIGERSVALRSVTEPFHYICTNCHAKGKQSVLYQLADTVQNTCTYRGPAVGCPACKTVLVGILHNH